MLQSKILTNCTNATQRNVYVGVICWEGVYTKQQQTASPSEFIVDTGNQLQLSKHEQRMLIVVQFWQRNVS